MKRKAPTRHDRPMDGLRDRPTKAPNIQNQPFLSPDRTSAFFPSATTDAFFQPSKTQPVSHPTSAAASAVPAPYDISFTHVNPPAQPDHSQLNPGPPGNAANRAGFTRMSHRPSLAIKWDNVAKPNAKGQIGLFVRLAKVGFNVNTLTIAISSKYAHGSCPYQVTRAHEYRHAHHFLKIFHSHRATMIKKAQGIPLPTEQAPRYMAPTQIGAAQKQISAPVAQAIRDVKKQMKADLNADRTNMDSPSSYAKEHAQCPKSDW